MIQQPLNEHTFLMIAMKHYDNPQCTTLAEFEEDLKRFGYLKKLFGRYKDHSELKERLILNHITVLYNLFGIATIELLFFKIDKEYWNTLATFLLYLNVMPDTIPEFGISVKNIQQDEFVMETLRKL